MALERELIRSLAEIIIRVGVNLTGLFVASPPCYEHTFSLKPHLGGIVPPVVERRVPALTSGVPNLLSGHPLLKKTLDVHFLLLVRLLGPAVAVATTCVTILPNRFCISETLPQVRLAEGELFTALVPETNSGLNNKHFTFRKK